MKLVPIKRTIFFVSTIVIPTYLFSQAAPPKIVAGIPVNYAEDSVGTYVLPDPLILNDGEK